MLSAFGVFVAVECRRVIGDVVIKFARDASCHLPGGKFALRRSVYLDPIAGIEDKRFGAAVLSQQTFGFKASAETLSRFHVRGMMT